jgi:hypothetical protein
LIVVVQFIVTRNRHVPFGPYLCAGAMLTIVFWPQVYNGWLACNLLLLWPFVKWLGPACLMLMGVMLLAMRMVRTAFGGVATD